MLALTRQDLNLPRIRHITTLHLSLTKCYFTLPTYNTPYYQLTSIAYYIRLYLPAMRYVTVLTYNGLYHLHALLTIHGIAYLEYITLLTYNILTYKHLHLVSLLTGRKRTSSERLASILITLRQTTSIWSLPTNSSSLK